MTWIRRVMLAAVLFAGGATLGTAGTLLQEELRIPFSAFGPADLEALLVRPGALRPCAEEI